MAALPAVLGAAPEGSRETLIYWAADRPILLSIAFDAKTGDPREPWKAAIRAFFDAFDTDRDGVISAKEHSADVLAMITAELTSMPDVQRASPPPDKLNLAALEAFLQQQGIVFCCVQSVVAPRRETMAVRRLQGNLPQSVDDDVLLLVLDSDQDGKLSRPEALGAWHTLRRIDLDDDEQLSVVEFLVAQKFHQPSSPTEEAAPRTPATATPPRITPLPAAAGRRAAVRELLARYDDDQNGSLSSRELGLPAGFQASLDRDASGDLDADELVQWLTHPTAASVIQYRPPSDAEGPPDLQHVSLGDQTLAVECRPVALPHSKDALLALLAQHDRDRNQYLSPSEVNDSPVLKPRFRLLDRDGDNKVFAAELLAYVERLAPLAARQMLVRVQLRGGNLFESIDSNRDSRLSRLELLRFAERIESALPGQPQAMPPQTMLEIGPIASWMLPAETRENQTALAQPPWFTSMDLNGDGVVSEREFLPPLQRFRALDTNRDRMLEPAEAIAQ